MNHLPKLLILTATLLPYSPAALAAEWVSVTTNAVGDRFFIDKSTIQRTDTTVRYWEYREFPQPNNAFLEETVDQPVHGVVLNWSADCTNKMQRLRQVTAYDKTRKVIRRFSYGETGSLAQPRSGSSSSSVLNYICDLK
ncbi:MAG: hypothetical protein HC866_10005 [Leptolyngbyaceae cyanobacterium RU_5_1]|nr:hypothetical protein [Leptolyngbyaceae cyanobacterium RU_5_1]